MTFKKSRHTSPHKHYICGKLWLCDCRCHNTWKTICMDYALRWLHLKKKKHLPFLLLKGDCQNMEQNTDKSLRLIHLIHPVSCCMSTNKTVSPAGVFLLSGSWSVTQVIPVTGYTCWDTLPLDRVKSRPGSGRLWLTTKRKVNISQYRFLIYATLLF